MNMKIVGHRGAAGLAPENTIASIKKALQHHVDMVEFDLRVTKDGVVILHHDPYLTDLNNTKHEIVITDYALLKNHKPDLASFEAALDAINKKAVAYIEIKPGVPTQPIIKIIQAYLAKGWNDQNFRIASFDQTRLLEMQTALPDIPKTVLESWSSIKAVRRAKQLGTQHIIMNQRWLWWGFIQAMSRRGIKLGAYTLNDPKKARHWQKYGLRAVITDYPDLFDKLKP
jgi:glycerophosphoryl diester phosphodiesterase